MYGEQQNYENINQIQTPRKESTRTAKKKMKISVGEVMGSRIEYAKREQQHYAKMAGNENL
jgi:hypothetical protein